MNLTFTNLPGLYGLLALPLILTLHLVRSRSRKQEISSLSLWDFLTPQLQGTSARKLPLTWLLLVDLLIALLLSLALAGPQLDLTRTVRAGRHLVLLLDTSTSMGAADEDPDRLTAAVRALRETVSAGSAGDLITVITFQDTASTAADSRDPDFQAQWRALEDIQAGGTGANLAAAMALARASIDPTLPPEVHIFTDAAFDPPELTALDLPVEWHLFGSSNENQAVLELAGTPLSALKFQVFARFANFGTDSVTRPFALSGDGQVLAEGEITVPPGASVTRSWDLVGSARWLDLTLAGSDSLAADDTATAAMAAAPGEENGETRVSVALVAERPGTLQRALEAAPGASVQVIAPNDYLPGSPYDLVVFQGFLPERWPGGSVLVVEPPADSALLGRVTERAITDAPLPVPDRLLEGVDFTGVRWDTVLVPEQPPIDTEGILLAGRTPLILHGKAGLTSLVILLVPVAGPDGAPVPFARHPAFPVLIANVVQEAGGIALPEKVQVGDAIPLPGAARYPDLRIERPDGQEELFNPDRPVRFEGTSLPGLYRIIAMDIDGREQVFQVGVSAGDLVESDIEPQPWPVAIESPPPPDTTTDQPLPLAPWLLAAAAALLLLEAWLAWR